MTATPAPTRSKYHAVVGWIGVVLVLGIGGVMCVRSCLPRYTPQGQLIRRLRVGMPLADVAIEAKRLGFVWRVEAPALEQPSKLQVICHEREWGSDKEVENAGGYVCEDLNKTPSFGIFFTSYACNMSIVGDVVEDFWFYMD